MSMMLSSRLLVRSSAVTAGLGGCGLTKVPRPRWRRTRAWTSRSNTRRMVTRDAWNCLPGRFRRQRALAEAALHDLLAEYHVNLVIQGTTASLMAYLADAGRDGMV